MIDLKNKIVFVHVPKCAGTSIEEYFMQIRGLDHRNRAALGIFKNDKSSELERGNQHCTLSMIEEFWFGGEIPEDFRIFTVVRNPFSRFWSEYSYRYLPPPDRYPISTRLPLGLLIHLARNPVPVLKDLNSHLRPQWTYLQGKAHHRVHVLRFESISEEFPALMQKWDLPDIGLPHSNGTASKRRRPTAGQLERGNAFVKEFYADDFASLGYSADSESLSTTERPANVYELRATD